MQGDVQSHLLRTGVQHRHTSRQHLSQHVPLWSARDPRLHRLDTDGEPQTDGPPMDRLRRTDRLVHLKLSLHSHDPPRSVCAA